MWDMIDDRIRQALNDANHRLEENVRRMLRLM